MLFGNRHKRVLDAMRAGTSDDAAGCALREYAGVGSKQLISKWRRGVTAFPIGGLSPLLAHAPMEVRLRMANIVLEGSGLICIEEPEGFADAEEPFERSLTTLSALLGGLARDHLDFTSSESEGGSALTPRELEQRTEQLKRIQTRVAELLAADVPTSWRRPQ